MLQWGFKETAAAGSRKHHPAGHNCSNQVNHPHVSLDPRKFKECKKMNKYLYGGKGCMKKSWKKKIKYLRGF